MTAAACERIAERPVTRMRTEARMVLRGASHTHLLLRGRLTALVLGTLALDAVATALMYAFEHAAPGSGFDDVGGALFWVSAELTTVSSQMPNPVTTPGRLLTIVIQVWAVSVVATLAASLASFFLTRHAEHVAGAAGPSDASPSPSRSRRALR